ncbi:MAG: hypothetical protein KDH92_14000 [Chloroflexi bacterium]|nr:hypothetical protein [Chloroflexota bacterium]
MAAPDPQTARLPSPKVAATLGLSLFAFLAAGPISGGAVRAQALAPGSPQAIQVLDGAWRFHAGDDPRWAAPDYDDSRWPVVEPGQPWGRMQARPDRGLGWYRQRLAVDPGTQLGIGLLQVNDAAEIYVDGQRVVAHGDPSRRVPGKALPFQGPVPVEASADGEILVAVRVWAGLHPRYDGRISALLLGPAETLPLYLDALLLRRWRQPGGLGQFFVGLLLTGLGLLHALIYRRRRAPEQGYFALAASLLGLHLSWQAGQFLGFFDPSGFYAHFSILMRCSAYAAMLAFGTELVGVHGRRPIQLAIAVLLLAGAFGALQPADPWWRLIPLAYGLAAVCGLGLLVRALRRGTPGWPILLPGFVPLVVWGLGDAFNNVLTLPAAYGQLRPWLSLTGTALLSGGMSVILALRFADSLDALDQSYRASARFVPTAFLKLLGRERITEVQRGDGVAIETTVMVCDIRDFSRLSEQRSPEATFRFINRFLASMEPCIDARGGFVAQYLGDGFLALFPGEAAAAIAAAIDMQAALEGFNARWIAEGERALRIGLGLHSGRVMLGTIGGAARMDANVVSDAVNTAARVEGLCKRYGAPVVISETTLSRATPGAWQACELDAVVVKGRSQALRVFEILEGEPDAELRTRKRSEAQAYAAALADFRAGDLDRAEAGFAALRGRDQAAAVFIDRCRWLRRQGLPEAWDGVTRLTVK